MLKNYLTIAWRNLLKNKLFSSINITGLSLGMAVALLIGLWITDETSFDHYYQNHDRLAQVGCFAIDSKGTVYTNQVVAMPIGNELRNNYGKDFERLSLVSGPGTHILAVGDKRLSGQSMYAQKDFADMFSLHIVAGRRDVLQDPSTCLLSRSMAQKLFDSQDPVNKTIRVDNGIDLKVGGVFEDLPHNTTWYETACIMPWENKANWLNSAYPQGDWNNHCGLMYVELKEHVSMGQAQAFVKHASTPHITGYEEDVAILPLDKLYLNNKFVNGKMSGGRIDFVWLFGTIGVFVLLLACINFMNLSTAKSERRAKEVGIR